MLQCPKLCLYLGAHLTTSCIGWGILLVNSNYLTFIIEEKRKDESRRQITAQFSYTSAPGPDLVFSQFPLQKSVVGMWSEHRAGSSFWLTGQLSTATMTELWNVLREMKHLVCHVCGLSDSDQSLQCIWGTEKMERNLGVSFNIFLWQLSCELVVLEMSIKNRL
jgi:hypothetical protein